MRKENPKRLHIYRFYEEEKLGRRKRKNLKKKRKNKVRKEKEGWIDA